jgi:hypothetical protein
MIYLQLVTIMVVLEEDIIQHIASIYEYIF